MSADRSTDEARAFLEKFSKDMQSLSEAVSQQTQTQWQVLQQNQMLIQAMTLLVSQLRDTGSQLGQVEALLASLHDQTARLVRALEEPGAVERPQPTTAVPLPGNGALRWPGVPVPGHSYPEHFGAYPYYDPYGR